MLCKVCVVCLTSVSSLLHSAVEAVVPAVEMSVGAASLPGHRPAEPNLLSLHAESD